MLSMLAMSLLKVTVSSFFDGPCVRCKKELTLSTQKPLSSQPHSGSDDLSHSIYPGDAGNMSPPHF